MIKADDLKWIIPSKEHSSISDNGKPCIRIIIAEEQYNMEPVDDKKIIELINEYLQSLNMPSVAEPKVIPIARDIRRVLVKRYHRCMLACNSMYTLVTRTTPRK